MSIKGLIGDLLTFIEQSERQFLEGDVADKGKYVIGLVERFGSFAAVASTEQNSITDLNELNEKLNMLLQAFENQDYDLMADILNYEIKPLFEYWSDQL